MAQVEDEVAPQVQVEAVSHPTETEVYEQIEIPETQRRVVPDAASSEAGSGQENLAPRGEKEISVQQESEGQGDGAQPGKENLAPRGEREISAQRESEGQGDSAQPEATQDEMDRPTAQASVEQHKDEDVHEKGKCVRNVQHRMVIICISYIGYDTTHEYV